MDRRRGAGPIGVMPGSSLAPGPSPALGVRMGFIRARLCLIICAVFAALGTGTSFAAFIVNPAQAIEYRLTVQVIQVARDDGSSPAPLFGTPTQQAAIFAGIDTIWAQAGIDVEFKFRLMPYQDTFTLVGNAGSGIRPTSDLNTIISRASNAGGVLDPDSKVLNLFMVETVPGFAPLEDNYSAGLAFVGGNGIAFWAGPDLPSFAGGREVISAVLAHEIGHNLGLDHISTAENLMKSSGEGERLTSAQIATARSSSLLVSVPEPGTVALFLCALPLIAASRPRRG